MGTSDRAPTDLLPLSEAVFQILLTLAEQPCHGYGIMQEVEERTDGRVCLGPGTLYGAIKRLREQGLLKQTSDAPDSGADGRRRYYRLTPFGRDVAAHEARRLERLVESARRTRLIPQPGSP